MPVLKYNLPKCILADLSLLKLTQTKIHYLETKEQNLTTEIAKKVLQALVYTSMKSLSASLGKLY